MSLKLSINGVEFNNPTMVAAGVLGTTGASLRRVAKAGAGGIVSKSISLEPKKGNKGPVLIETDYGVINSMGLPNPGANYFKKELNKLKEINKPLICSIFGETPRKIRKVIRILEDFVDVFELNLSCPNVEGEIICSDINLVEKFVYEASNETEKPLWVKLSSNTGNQVQAAKAAVKSGADSIVLINTLKAMLIDIESGRPVLGNIKGGLSGEAIHPIAVENVYKVSKEIDVPVVGVGGITSAEDAIELMMAGARAVQIGTGLKNGLSLFDEINNGISDFIEKKDLNGIKEIISVSHQY